MIEVKKPGSFLLLDVGRGWAALWVVMDHASVSFVVRHPHPALAAQPLYAISLLGQLGVILFFVISGYCITGAACSALVSGKGISGYAYDRVRRIYPPYFAALVAAGVCWLIISWLQHHGGWPGKAVELPWQDFHFWLANLFLLQAEWNQPRLILVSWTLCYEIIFYALVGLGLALALASKKKRVLGWGLFILTQGSLLWLLLAPLTCPFPLNLWYPFGLGALLFLLLNPDQGGFSFRETVGQLGLAVSMTTLFAWRFSLSSPDSGFDLVPSYLLGHPSTRWQAVTTLLFLGVLWLVHPWDRRLARQPMLRPWLWLGTISYSLYLVHLLITPVIDFGLRHLGFDSAWYPVTYLMQILGAVGAGWIFYQLVERHCLSSRQKKRLEMEMAAK